MLSSIHPEQVMQRDLAWLKRRRAQLARFRGPKDKRARLQQQYDQRLQTSMAQLAQRRESLPAVTTPTELPISRHTDAIVKAIRDNPVVIVAGETGSGKSTQLPKLCLAAGRGQRGLIGCTQPRRIAARSVARRVAEELGSELGQLVGFQVRFNEQVSADSYIKFMTDGVLLAEIHRDRHLDAYDTLIIDEAHERSLNIDFLLGYLKQLIARRPDLKVVITSATIDTERFANHFDQAPVISVEGRGYPVEIQYQAPLDGEGLPDQVRRAVQQLTRIDPRGDVLVFLPGEREIFQVSRALRQAQLRHTEVLPLYARLPAASQDQIFRPGALRRIVLATNVAETSLTVPGIRFVIDSGLARISRYAAHSRVLRLPVEPVSRASGNQRAGRCGRIGLGTCIRLFDEADFESRPAFTEPEIQRAGLVGVVLEMLALKLGEPENFPFIDAPPKRLLGEAWQTLLELQAVDRDRHLSDLGQTLARLPVDARHGRILIEAQKRGVLADALVLVSALSVADVRERPLEQQQAADQAHQQFAVPESDFLSLLKLWQWWQQQRQALSRSQADRLARKQFLSPQRLHEWGQLHGQLSQIARAEGWQLGRSESSDSEDLHRSLLAGLLSMIGQHQEKGEYQGARGHGFRIFPGSVLAKRQPGWLMAAELVETGRTYARLLAPIKPTWLEQQAAHLVKRRYFDPVWDQKSGRVMGFEQVSLYGLMLVEKRRVHYGPHDPATARALFIRHALVRGEIHSRAEFLKKNQALRDELADHERKRRKRDVLAGERELEDFFEQRLPATIWTTKTFAAWYQALEPAAQDQLLFDHATLLREDAELAGREAFPDALVLGRERFVLSYHFDPASDSDGVVLDCPLHLLNQLDAQRLEWLVPGLLREKITALITSLPKSLRRSLIPAADFGRAAFESLEAPEGDLLERLAGELNRMTGLNISSKDFRPEKLPLYLRFLIRVLDESGKLLGQARDLSELSRRYSGRARAEFMARQSERWQCDGLSPAQLPGLPEEITTRGGHRAWPAWIAQGRQVGVRLFDDPMQARKAHRRGLAVLLRESMAEKWKYLEKQPGLSRQAQLAWTRVEDIADLTRALRELIIDEFCDQSWQIRDQAALASLVDSVRPVLLQRYQARADVLDKVLIEWHGLQQKLRSLAQAVPAAVEDMNSQLDDLMYAGFLADLSGPRLAHYPRYLQAMQIRLNALELDPVRDGQRWLEIKPWWTRYLEHLAGGGAYDDRLDNFRWLIEELRVQVFAQKLGTACPVSEKRLQRAWAQVHAGQSRPTPG